MNMDICTVRKQGGFSLTEALVAFVITAVGLMAIASFQTGLFSTSAYNKARTEALSLAQEKIEEFKQYTLLSEDNFIDDNADGVMDPDDTYQEGPINGQNAAFTRSWELTTVGEEKQVDVTVSWQDSANQPQSVMLGTVLTWIPPRAEGDQMADLASPSVPSPTGRATIGDGNLSDYPSDQLEQVSSPGEDGLSEYRYDEDLFLTDPTGKILLTLVDACSTVDGTCIDFVKISGTVYVDTANSNQSPEDIQVVAADASHCQRWVPTGSTLANPPATASGDYLYYHYTCYLGGGWHGNIGFVTTSGLQQRDKVCQGDPTSVEAWNEPVIALRRAYRGMIHTGNGANEQFFSHGIKDATVMTGHDFVFTELSPSNTDGANCIGADAPMTRDDSSAGLLFQGVPTDFVCLNSDNDGDSVPDYLDSFDANQFAADTFCPYDPTDPPVQHHVITGLVSISASTAVDTSNFSIVSSDGPGNCAWVAPFAPVAGGFQATYACNVYDWGSGWTGFLVIAPGSNYIYCPSRTATFGSVQTDQTHDFGCTASPTVTVKGQIVWGSDSATISSIVIRDLSTGFQGACMIQNDTGYYCQIPYSSDVWNGTIKVTSNEYVCGSSLGVFTFSGLTAEGSPYTHHLQTARNASSCLELALL
jgi:Tfp pilus assembly protein PilV